MYKWYDGLQEPKRFLVFFIPAAILIAGVNIPYYGINIISLSLLLIVLISRIIYIHKWSKMLRTFINKMINIPRGGQ